MQNKCVFLDRDGVINKDNPDYVYKVEDLFILEGVKESLAKLKQAGYLIIVITNQSGIDRSIYIEGEVNKVHAEIQSRTGNHIDEFYFSPYHRLVSNSLSAKPNTLLFEKAIAKYSIDTYTSWMVGDRLRDLIPAEKLGIKTILVESEYNETHSGIITKNLLEAVDNYICYSRP